MNRGAPVGHDSSVANFTHRLPESKRDILYARRLLLVRREYSDTEQFAGKSLLLRLNRTEGGRLYLLV